MNKFREIFFDLEERILAGEYPPQSLLPSENQLIAMYHVSRETIRKALNLLRDAGYIQKKQGKGSIVLDIRRFDFPISGLTSFKELQETQRIPNETKVLELKKIAVSPSISKKTDWPVASESWKLIRQRKIDDEVAILDIDYLTCRIIEELPLKKVANSLYEFVENDLGLIISYAKKEITVEVVNKEIREMMELPKDETHAVFVRSIVFLDDTRCFEYTESIHQLDKFRFSDFARRRKL